MTTTAIDHVETVKAAIDKFHKVAAELANYGATDSEPVRLFERIIRRLLHGNPASVPDTITGWQLYDMNGAGDAALKLHAAATEVVNTIENVPIGKLRDLKKHFLD